MSTIDDLLQPRAAAMPLRLLAVADDDRKSLRAACSAHDLKELDVKRLRDRGVRTVEDLLLKVACAFGSSRRRVPADVVQVVAAQIRSSGRRVLVHRVPEDLLAEFLRCLHGVASALIELMPTTWEAPPRLLVVLTPAQAASRLVGADESNVLDFSDPREIAVADDALGLPVQVNDLVDGARALLAATPTLPAQAMAVVERWPDLDLRIHSRWIEAVPKGILRSFVLALPGDAERTQRWNAATLHGAPAEYLRGSGAAGPVGLRYLVPWILPPMVRSARDDAMLRGQPLWRAALQFAKREELDALRSLDVFYGEARAELGALVEWLGRTLPVSWDHVLSSSDSLNRLSTEDHGRIQLAASVDTTYRVRLAEAHGVPRSLTRHHRVGDRLAATFTLAAMVRLEAKWPLPGSWIPTPVPTIASALQQSGAFRKLKAAVDRLPQELASASNDANRSAARLVASVLKD